MHHIKSVYNHHALVSNGVLDGKSDAKKRGCKKTGYTTVNARFITNESSDGSVDLSNLKASKDATDANKVMADKLNLAIDYLVTCLPQRHHMKYASAQNIQVSGLQAEICSLKLIDSGLYIHDLDFDVSLISSIHCFGSKLIDLLRMLLHFRRNVASDAVVPR